jgi:hypothetical protein
MTPEQAAWVRDNALTPRIIATSGPLHLCACQLGQSTWCHNDKHSKCAHLTNPRWYDRGTFETLLQRADGSGVTWPGFVQVDVWLADRTCVWRCSCGCHAPASVPAPVPAAPPMAAAVADPEAWGDGLLFDLEAV